MVKLHTYLKNLGFFKEQWNKTYISLSKKMKID